MSEEFFKTRYASSKEMNNLPIQLRVRGFLLNKFKYMKKAKIYFLIYSSWRNFNYI